MANKRPLVNYGGVLSEIGAADVLSINGLMVTDPTDTTKHGVFSAANIGTGTTRTYTLPPETGTFTLNTATQTLTNKTLTSPTIDAPSIGSPTITGNTGMTTGNLVMTAVNAAIELGAPESNLAYIDFHTGATPVDYDSRIIASGGNGSSGGGTLTVDATLFAMYADMVLLYTRGDTTASVKFSNANVPTATQVVVSWPAASGTLAVLGANTFTGDQTLGNNNLKTIKTATFNSQVALTTTTGAVTVDWSSAQNYKQNEPTGAITYTFTAPAGPCRLQLLIDSDGTSSAYTHVWPGTVIWMGSTWAQSPNKKSIITFWYDGTNYYAMGVTQV